MTKAVPRPIGFKFGIGWPVRRIDGSNLLGKVVGFYSTEFAPEGYAVESKLEQGSVQIFPVEALEATNART